MLRRLSGLFLALACAWLASAAIARAEPRFPELTGRIVDEARLLSPAKEVELTDRLAALEAKTTDQLVVVTLTDLGGYDIADYGYRLGRHWRIGQADRNNGVLLIVAAEERKVRIEVGYGLEPVLTDAMSDRIIREEIVPAFRNGGFERGITQGVAAIETQLTLDPAEAEARALAAAEPSDDASAGISIGAVIVLIIAVFVVITILRAMSAGGRGRRRGRRRRGAPIVWTTGPGGWDGGGGGSFGGGGFGGGGFSGGGGSFGGGGASGGW